MNRRHKLDSLVSLLIFLLACALLAIYLGGCAPDAHAGIRVEWIHIDGTETMGLGVLETDGRRLYTSTKDGVYLSDDDGYTWRPTELVHSTMAIAISRNAVYAGTNDRGVFRSDSRGVTWNPINNGIRPWEAEPDKEIRYPRIETILVTRSGAVITVMYHQGTYTSTDRGDTWHDVIDDWILPGNNERRIDDFPIATGIWSMTEFDGYLWASYSSGGYGIYRFPDNDQAWETTSNYGYGEVRDWAALDGRLVVGAVNGLARWSEAGQAWEYFFEGLPELPNIRTLAVNRGRLFAGTASGVYMFDERSEIFIPAGLQHFSVGDLVSHQSDLYAKAYAHGELSGIYRASIPVVQPYNKAATTWGAVKRK